ncbi:MAG: TIGR04282 family arsenosugar biosynthesis glycosyltransferase [Cyanobacteria bacterium]|nr:TIGR04282 family arsenosugar biosynthesis glycosyltransferase [Cyanobacteriota bacterium]
MGSSAAVLVFLKEPVPGRVKSRLAAGIGTDRAAAVYRAFVLDWLERLTAYGRSREVAILPCPSPDGWSETLAQWLDGEIPGGSPWRSRPFLPQGSGDLGDRLGACFRMAWEMGIDRAIVVGTDSPDLPLGHLDLGFEAIARGDCALGPALDGGYYALGFSDRTFVPSAFKAIAWSSDQTAAQTLTAIATAGHSTTLLPPWGDIDHPEDLRRLGDRLRDDHPLAHGLPRTVETLARLGLIVESPPPRSPAIAPETHPSP